MIEGCAHPDREGCSSGGEPKGDLFFLSKRACTLVRSIRTKSAKESSSCPMREDLLRHRATLPSIKSKNNPKGMNARAAQRLA